MTLCILLNAQDAMRTIQVKQVEGCKIMFMNMQAKIVSQTFLGIHTKLIM